ncbi:MAG: aldo/keto reductase, partial [Chloroflexi bacterium]|nr:aldo/keto reductase [Chloroflexota bacterium]
AWVLAQTGLPSAIVGASTASQIEDSLKYSEIELSEEDLEFCDRPWYEIPRPTDPEVAMR